MTEPVFVSDETDMSTWHPEIVGLYAHWKALGNGHPPGRRDLDPVAMRSVLPHLWILDYQADPPRLRYRLVGTKIVQMVGRELKGQWLDEAHPAAQDPRYIERYRMTAERRQPSWRRGTAWFWHERVNEIENIVLPLASEGSAIDGFLVQTRFYGADGREI